MKRVKVSLEFPEKLFYEKLLIEWKNNIPDKNQACTINKAYDNLHRFPIDITGYKELRQIKGIGEHIATRLDAAWKKICEMHFCTSSPTLNQVKSLKKGEAFSFLETAFVAKGRHNIPFLKKKKLEKDKDNNTNQLLNSINLDEKSNFYCNQNNNTENLQIFDCNTSFSQPTNCLNSEEIVPLKRSFSQKNLFYNVEKENINQFITKSKDLTNEKEKNTVLMTEQNFLQNCKASTSSSSSLTQNSLINKINLENETGTMLSYNFCNYSSCKLILIIDEREKNDRNRKLGITQHLEKLGVNFEVRPLSIGDYLWVLKMENNADELVLDYIVERKTWDDLRSSIRKTRFYEQKRRLKESGIRNVVLIAEGQQTNDRSLEQALVTTSVDNCFMIHRTLSMQGTAKFLKHLTNRFSERLKSEHFYGPSFVSFQDASRKTKLLTVKDCWLRQLTVCPSMSIEKALQISNVFPTMRSLADFYRTKAEEARNNKTVFDASIILHEKIDEIPKALSNQLSMFFVNDCCK